MFSFLNSSMSGATSRFLTYELGKGDFQRLRNTFSSALIIHIGIAVIVLILSETIGLWFLSNKLVIPDGRMEAAHWVYQCSILSAMLSITQVPYNSLIIAHERMSVYAYIEILNVTLKLLIVYILMICNFDKLKLYSVLVLCVSVIVMLAYRLYCLRKFSESHFSLIWKKEILLPMLSFTSWDFYGNMCGTVRQQGNNFFINNFFGIAANAASSIATTVNVIVGGFASNIITAFRPRIIKSFSNKNWCEMQTMVNNAIKFTLLFFIMLAIPVFFETSFALKIWLRQVPQYAVPFIRLILIANGLGIINSVIIVGIHATGKIKRLSFITGTVYLLSLPLVYLLLKLGYDVNIVYIVYIFSNFLIIGFNLWILGYQVRKLSIFQIFREIVVVILITILSIIPILISYKYCDSHVLRLLMVFICDFLIFPLLIYALSLNKDQRTIVKNFVKNKLIARRGDTEVF